MRDESENLYRSPRSPIREAHENPRSQMEQKTKRKYLVSIAYGLAAGIVLSVVLIFATEQFGTLASVGLLAIGAILYSVFAAIWNRGGPSNKA